MLANYSSLWEVFTAFFCSMLLDNILGNIWTPEYKKNVIGLVKDMGTPFVDRLADKLKTQIEKNVKEISGHMRRRAIFMICFCMCILILTGAEGNLGFNSVNETEILFRATIIGLLVVCLGKWTFCKFKVTIPICFLYSIAFILLCHFGHNLSITWSLLKDEKYAIGFVILFMMFPLFWQLLSCWIYSSLYYGKLKSELHQEESDYKRAIIGIRTKNLEIVPEIYKIRAAVDIHHLNDPYEDISYASCDEILYTNVDKLLDNPIPLKILISWVRCLIFRVCFKPSGDDDFVFVNKQFNIIKQESSPVSGLSHKDNVSDAIKVQETESIPHALQEPIPSKRDRSYKKGTLIALSSIGIASLLYKLRCRFRK